MQQTMLQGLQEGEGRNAVEILLGLPLDSSDKRRAESPSLSARRRGWAAKSH